ncbi:hypothetical protein GH714_011983 [Hevea brasiliensis]|uniref:NB-ARC domain-containing protein n=1 Tax=Hevea brasiliensis TaxID=3981 RepID=A0A6A6L189_HEVBR|nr:hypothetical protein GH714_011983 [Hevea brasiliensis]
MDALRDPNLNKIGVYGMGGVGKTTLAKEVHRQAIEEKLFDEVVMVAVNQTPELRRIQSEIADVLGLTFDVEEIPGRANRLYERLKKEKDEEAWSLFEMTLADAKDSELPPIATEVAKKCAGLPLLYTHSGDRLAK